MTPKDCKASISEESRRDISDEMQLQYFTVNKADFPETFFLHPPILTSNNVPTMQMKYIN